MLVAVVGAATGLWATLNDYASSEFQKPITLREAKVKSFQSQIASAKDRNDDDEVLRVTLAYEKYEESWRNRQTLSSITESIRNLDAIQVSQDETNQLKELLKDKEFYNELIMHSPEQVGSAYLATGEFAKASHYYQTAAYLEPQNGNISALRAVALQGEAEGATTEDIRQELLQRARRLEDEAKAKGVDPTRLEALSRSLKANN